MRRAIVIVQHMPEKFTANFAQRLNTLCRVTVKEAGRWRLGFCAVRLLLRRGNRHMLLKRQRGLATYVEVRDGAVSSAGTVRQWDRALPLDPRVYCRAKNAVGVIMDRPWATMVRKGLLEMKVAGAHTIAQGRSELRGVRHAAGSKLKLGGVNKILSADRHRARES